MTDTDRIDWLENFLRVAAEFGGNPPMGLKLVPAGESIAVIMLGPDEMLVAPSLREAIDVALAAAIEQ